MTYVRSGTDTTQSGDAGGTVINWTVDTGAAVTNGCLLVWLYARDRGQTYTAPTYNGVSMTSLGTIVAQGSSLRAEMFRLVAPASGSNTLSVDPSAASGAYNVNLHWALYEDIDQADPELDASYTVGQDTSAGAGTVSAVDIPSVASQDVAVAHGIRNGGGAYTATASGFTEDQDSSAGASISVESGHATAADTLTETTATWTDATASSWIAIGVCLNPATGSASAAVTGSLASGTKTQANIVSGDDGLGNPITIILTLTGDTWVATGATFDAQRQAIINGLDAASSPATGWNALVRDVLAVTAVVRTSDTIVTITIPAVPTYAITADEVITCTIPAAALTGAVEITASPTITIHYGVRLSAYSGTTNGSGVLTTNLTSDQALVRTLTTAYVNGTVVARTTTRPT